MCQEAYATFDHAAVVPLTQIAPGAFEEAITKDDVRALVLKRGRVCTSSSSAPRS